MFISTRISNVSAEGTQCHFFFSSAEGTRFHLHLPIFPTHIGSGRVQQKDMKDEREAVNSELKMEIKMKVMEDKQDKNVGRVL